LALHKPQGFRVGKAKVLADFKGVESETYNHWKVKELQAELDQGYGFAVSNCSFYNEKDTAAWITEGKDNKIQVVGV